MRLTPSDTSGLTPLQRHILLVLHLLVLAASLVMVVWITRETLSGVSFLSSHGYMRFQFWVCFLFMADILVEWSLSPRKWHYFVSNIFFILISIPWLNLIEAFGVSLSPMMGYVMKFVPMIRAGYVLALISGALMFFVEEHFINPLVDSYWSSLWWAALNITTVGCEISPVTITGKVLAIILSAEGLTLFPVFTIYVTNSIVNNQK